MNNFYTSVANLNGLALALVVAFAAACSSSSSGGNGNAGAPGDVETTLIASFSEIEPNSTIELEGSAVTATFEIDEDDEISAFAVSDPADITVQLDFDGDTELAALRATGTGPDVDIQPADGFDEFTETEGRGDGLRIAEGENADAEQSVLIALGAEAATDFEYMILGQWDVDDGASGSSSYFAAGIRTASPPETGTADYIGVALATLVDVDSGDIADVRADMAASVDFGPAGGFTFNTSGSQRFDEDNILIGAAPELDLSATGSLDGARLSGDVTSAGGLSGQLSGSLYGADAGELGGVYQLEGGSERMLGAFGGVRQ